MTISGPRACLTAAHEIPRCDPPQFDLDRQAWVLTRYADVSAALRDSRLGATSPGEQAEPGAVDAVAHNQFRESAKATLSAANVDGWLGAIPLPDPQLHTRPNSEQPIDLLAEFAQPWSVQLAVAVTGTDPAQAGHLNELARDIFMAASDPFDQALKLRAGQATREMAAMLGDALKLQAFVALTQTLPCFLATAWLALLLHPSESQALVDHPELLPSGVEELLRYAGPSRAQFRRALCDLTIGGAEIASGQLVILMLAAANRDPAEFPEPDRLNVRRIAPNHLAFGGGQHACLGAGVIRAAAVAACRAFLHYFRGAELCEPVLWHGGVAIQAPQSVRVRV